ncbi:MAG: DsbC family protein [Pseudomonas sp.]
MRVIQFFAAIGLSLACSVSLASGPDQVIRKALLALQPDLPIEAIAPSPLAGIYQVQLQGGRLLYASADGQFLIQGSLLQLKDGQAVDLTAQAQSQGIVKELDKIARKDMVVFTPKVAKTHITVFTDTDCVYCQKLHSEVPELNRLGIEVRYLAFPRQGVGSHGYNGLVSVWCAKDQQAAMTQAKSRKELPAGTCDNPVAQQYQLGQLLGVNGTPAIILADGQMIPGYRPAAELAKLALQAQ